MNTPKTPTRIYLVRNTDTGDERLVRAPNVARALAHITSTSYSCEVATQDQLVALLTADTPAEVEDAQRSAVSADNAAKNDAEEGPLYWPERKPCAANS
jgi:hypothetical protein